MMHLKDIIFILSIIYTLNLTSATLHVNLCCAKASGNCRQACEEITTRLLANEDEFSRSDLTTRLLDYCPNNNIPLWRCINQTDSQGENEIKWAGRVCCHLAETEPCHQACKHADRFDDITSKCRMSDEITLYECVEKKQKGEACCDMARNSRCHSVCRKSLVSRRVTRQHMETACAGNVQNCMSNLNAQNTFIISSKLGHCCDLTQDVFCREKCKLLVNSKASDISIYQDLHQNNCGMVSLQPNPPDVQEMWSCITFNAELQQALSGSYGGGMMGGGSMGGGSMGGGYPINALFPGGVDTSNIGMLNPGGIPPSMGDPWRPNRRPTLRITTPRPNNNIQEVGMDVTKAYCCSKGTTARCRKLCHAAFSTEWQTQWKDFEVHCLRSPEQQQLIQCLEDVNESCELGCDGMSFCTSFNYRTTELFRGCNKLNDEAAAKEFERWQMTSVIEIPHLNADYKLYIKNISQCAPQVWKAIACTLLIKPCTKQTHSNRICRANCYEMLKSCLDWQKMAGISSPAEICNILSPDDSENCINLDHYMEEKKPPPLRTTTGKLIKIHGKTLTTKYDMSMKASPCKNHTCNPMQVCTLNRACSRNVCPDYDCQIGCKLGEISPHMVPAGTYAKILTNAPSNEKVCSKICQCTAQGMFNNCHPQYCISLDICKQDTRIIEHGTVLNGSCPKCVCHSGELVCNKHQCKNKSNLGGSNTEESESSGEGPSRYTGLPCNCSLHYTPVCGWNGVTFPNDCIAKCNGLQEDEFRLGTCSFINPCDSSPCAHNEQCLWTPKVCMYSLGKDCPQFECVRREERCLQGNYGVMTTQVCAESENTYDSVCELVRSKDKLQYKGPCLGSCEEEFEICGKDGNTYKSECTAHAHKVMRDYKGACKAFGIPSQKPRCDKSIKCPKLPRERCTGYIPPGSCCPFCGSALRILFSVREIDKAMQSLGMRARDVFTTENVISSLERHVQVKNCRLFGHISIEGDLIVMVLPTKETKVTREIELCNQEAEKIKVMINTRNPRFLSEVALSPLLYARSVHHPVSSSSVTITYSFVIFISLIANYLLR